MEVRHFKLIQAVAETGSLTKAADKLFLTQSALSHQLRDLEAHLNTRVFVRKNGKLVLTSGGQALLKSAAVILNELSRVRNEIAMQGKEKSGSIKISTECNTCYHWLPGILKEFQASYPNVDIRLNTVGTKSPKELLSAGKIDVAIIYRTWNNRSISFTQLFTDDVVAIVPVDHPLADRKYLMPKDFAKETYITHSTALDRSIFYEEFLKPGRIRPKKVLHIHLTEAALAIVTAGLGITVMAKWLVQPSIDPAKLRMVKLGRSGLKRKWYIAVATNVSQESYIRDFIVLLRNGLKTTTV
jgi:LysR family transcriptional regulator for metE and metH